MTHLCHWNQVSWALAAAIYINILRWWLRKVAWLTATLIDVSLCSTWSIILSTLRLATKKRLLHNISKNGQNPHVSIRFWSIIRLVQSPRCFHFTHTHTHPHTHTHTHTPTHTTKKQKKQALAKHIHVSPPNTYPTSPNNRSPTNDPNKSSTMAHGRDLSLQALSPSPLARANLSPPGSANLLSLDES